MKKTFLLFALSFAALASNGQVSLTGSSYTQNFDGLSTGLPTGWTVRTAATSSNLGTLKSLTSTLPGIPFETRPDTGCNTPDNCAGLVRGGGFKNFPSADNSTLSTATNFCPSCTQNPGTFANRALGLRQVAGTNTSFPDSDPGAAFTFNIANTINLTNLNLTFKLQSLDTASGRTTVWTVDYGFGTAPTSFTAATATGIMTTGNHIYSNNNISVNFGTALDNKTTPVWIRIVALSATSGFGNRASTAIDSFKLTYTNNTNGVEEIASSAPASLTVLGNPTSDKVEFAYSVTENGAFNFAIYDLSGRIVRKEEIMASTGTHTASGLNLAPGMYIARMSNEAGSAVAKFIIK